MLDTFVVTRFAFHQKNNSPEKCICLIRNDVYLNRVDHRDLIIEKLEVNALDYLLFLQLFKIFLLLYYGKIIFLATF